MTDAVRRRRDRPAALGDRALAGSEKLRFFPLVAASGNGCLVTDEDGREYLDLSAGWTAAGIGYAHPEVVAAVTDAITHQAYTGGISASIPVTSGLVEDLISRFPHVENPRVYLGNSGTDANDVALRLCREYTGRRRIISFENSYHGGLGLAMAVSGVHVAAGVAADLDTTFLPYPDPVRPHTGDPQTVAEDVLARLHTELERGDVAALIIEPIQSDGGLVIPPAGFLRRVVDMCQVAGVPTIVDEVKVGLARTGRFNAFDHDQAAPTIVTLGKSLGGGLPISAAIGPAVILDQPVASALLTMAGNPVCAASARAVLRVIDDEGLVLRAAESGERMRAALHAAAQREGVTDVIRDIRGLGLTIGVDLVHPGDGGARDVDLARKSVYRAWQLGVILYYVGGNVLEITPGLIISDEHIDFAADVVMRAVREARAGAVTNDEIASYTGW